MSSATAENFLAVPMIWLAEALAYYALHKLAQLASMYRSDRVLSVS